MPATVSRDAIAVAVGLVCRKTEGIRSDVFDSRRRETVWQGRLEFPR